MFVVLFSFSFTEQKDIPRKAVRFVQKATDAFKEKDLEKTNKFLEKAKKVYSDYAAIYCLYGRINSTQQKYQKAVEAFEKALTLDPQYKEAQGYYIDLLIKIGQNNMRNNPQAAIDYFKKVLNIKEVHSLIPKKTCQLSYMTAQLYQKLKKFKLSTEYFKKFLNFPNTKIDFADGYSLAYYSIGINYIQLADLQESNLNLNKFIELNSIITEKNKGLVATSNYLFATNNYETLEKLTKKIEEDSSIKTNKEKIRKQAEIAKTYRAKIVPKLEKAIELNPTYEDNYKYLGNFYVLTMEFEKAIAQFKILTEKFTTSQNLDSYKSILDALKKKLSK
jgi:tetratricopeptide (TPR) repeat protein